MGTTWKSPLNSSLPLSSRFVYPHNYLLMFFVASTLSLGAKLWCLLSAIQKICRTYFNPSHLHNLNINTDPQKEGQQRKRRIIPNKLKRSNDNHLRKLYFSSCHPMPLYPFCTLLLLSSLCQNVKPTKIIIKCLQINESKRHPPLSLMKNCTQRTEVDSWCTTTTSTTRE